MPLRGAVVGPALERSQRSRIRHGASSPPSRRYRLCARGDRKGSWPPHRRSIPEADRGPESPSATSYLSYSRGRSRAFGALDYGRVADLVHATDDVVVSEIESWQAVFGGKHVTVPV